MGEEADPDRLEPISRTTARVGLKAAEDVLGIRRQTDEARAHALTYAIDAIDYLGECIRLGREQPKYRRLAMQAAKGIVAVTLPAAVQTTESGAVAALEAIRGTAEALRDALKLRLEAGAAGLDVSGVRLPGDDEPDPTGKT